MKKISLIVCLFIALPSLLSQAQNTDQTKPNSHFGDKQVHDPPLLYNISEDPTEKYNVADEHPEILAETEEMVERHKQNLVEVEDQLTERESN